MLLIISGPSAIGKDSTWLRICENSFGFERIVPYTTRGRRPEEKEGFDYFFVTKAEFHDLIKQKKLLEWDYFNKNYYGTPILNLDDTRNYAIHALGRIALRLKQKVHSTYLVMLLPEDNSILSERLVQRGYRGDDLLFRNYHHLEEKEHAPLFDFVVPNAEAVTTYEAEEIIQKILNNY
jgi:guanylate kinase